MTTATLAVAGDTMLGRKVGELLDTDPDAPILAPEIVDVATAADACLVNLECCISERGERWPDPAKPFFFRAPPTAVRVLTELGTDVVNLANNHALDYGAVALTDTFDHLAAAGIGWVGAGRHLDEAREPVRLDLGGLRVTLIGATDHPADFAAAPDAPGVAYADLRAGRPTWLERAVAAARDAADLVIVTVHWGPNMVAAPVPHVRAAADRLLEVGADLIVGHSAHVFHGVRWAAGAAVLYDLGDFVDDYAVDRWLRNDLGLFWLLHLDERGVRRIEAVPLALDYRATRIARDEERDWIERRLTAACDEFGTRVRSADGKLVTTPG